MGVVDLLDFCGGRVCGVDRDIFLLGFCGCFVVVEVGRTEENGDLDIQVETAPDDFDVRPRNVALSCFPLRARSTGLARRRDGVGAVSNIRCALGGISGYLSWRPCVLSAQR